MNNYDVPIMLLFFNRPDVLKKTWEWIEAVKPLRLFLVQDGARSERMDDIENIKLCRKIVSNITWDCEVKTNYAEKNMGCDYREFSGIDWCFNYVDRLIILEDDCKPSVSFYQFCGELLEKYLLDSRIHMISGFNRVNSYSDCPYDYLFSFTGAGLGWATWKRVWMQVKELEQWQFLSDDIEGHYLTHLVDLVDFKSSSRATKSFKQTMINDTNAGHITSWEKILGATNLLSHSLTITPTKNMIEYLGVTTGATHSVDSSELLPRKTRNVLCQSAYELNFPIHHPPYVVRDRVFEEKDYKAFRYSFQFILKIESLLLKIRYNRWDLILNGLKKHIKKK